MTQCFVCHGMTGKGDGPAGQAMNPKPRDFTKKEGWKKTRKPSHIFDVLTHGLQGTSMPPFSGLSEKDRWTLTHYVLFLGPKPEQDLPDDIKKLGLDLVSESSVSTRTPHKNPPPIPIDLAIELMAKDGKVR